MRPHQHRELSAAVYVNSTLRHVCCAHQQKRIPFTIVRLQQGLIETVSDISGGRQ
jgi:hypothetical protein